MRKNQIYKKIDGKCRTKSCSEWNVRWSYVKCTQKQYCFAIYLVHISWVLFVFGHSARDRAEEQEVERKSSKAREKERTCVYVCVDSYCCRTQQDIHRTDYQIMCVRILLLLLYTLLSFKCSKNDLICTICMWIEHTPGPRRAHSQSHTHTQPLHTSRDQIDSANIHVRSMYMMWMNIFRNIKRTLIIKTSHLDNINVRHEIPFFTNMCTGRRTNGAKDEVWFSM